MKLLLLILLFTFTSCLSLPSDVVPTDFISLSPTAGAHPSHSVSNLKPGTSLVIGSLFLPDGTPLTHTTLYLTPGIGDKMSAPIILIGPILENGDYFTNTISDAAFIFANVEPGTYYLVVSSTNSFHFYLDGTNPVPILLEANEQLDLGKIIVDTR